MSKLFNPTPNKDAKLIKSSTDNLTSIERWQHSIAGLKKEDFDPVDGTGFKYSPKELLTCYRRDLMRYKSINK